MTLRLPTFSSDFRPRARRSVTLAFVVAGHLLIIVLMLLVRAPADPQRDDGALQLFDVSDKSGAPASAAAPAPREAAAPEPKPSPVVLPAPVLPPGGGALTGAATGPGALEGGCAIAATLGRAIESDPAALATLAALPPEARTSADAVLLWNGTWLQVPAPDGTDSIATLRSVVEQTYLTAAPECVESIVAGPQFIPVVMGDKTLMLVVGSGEWRWRDLAQPNIYEPQGMTDEDNFTSSQ